MGALSFSPSPITTVPFIAMEPSTGRMASTAAWSTASLSPYPRWRAAAMAAASVARTSSRARLRSGSGARPPRRAFIRPPPVPRLPRTVPPANPSRPGRLRRYLRQGTRPEELARMDEAGGRRWRDWGVAVTALLALLLAVYTVGFVLGWGGPDERAKLTYALY